MAKRRPPTLDADPPWMRLGPASDDPVSGDDGEKLWHEMTRRVTPLAETRQRKHAAQARLRGKSKEVRAPVAAEPAKGAARGADKSPPPRLAQPRLGGGHFPGPPAAAHKPALSHGAASGVDARSLAKLRRGLMPVEAEIDLHGATQEKAHAALLRFVSRQHAAGSRCVRVVTGKGLKRDWSVGVLREAVPRWLNEAPLRSMVLAFSYATPDDGGAGALYVLLKRKR